MSNELRITFRCVLALTLVFVVGCSDTTAPTGITGTYALTTIDGQPLPYTVFESEDNGGEWHEEIVAGSITLEEETWAITTEWRETDLTTGEVASDAAVLVFTR